MSRDIATVIAQSLDDEVLQPFFAVDLEFDSGTLRLWTGVGAKVIDGNTYTGAGNFLQVSEMRETAELRASGVTLSLNGIPSNVLSLALQEPYQERPARVYFGLIGQQTAMSEVFTARMDQMTIEEGAEVCTIQLSIENVLIDLERSRVLRFTNNNQQSRFPDDRGFEFVETIQQRELFWGRTATAPD